ncbi:hypothetical protein AQUCO_01000635v1 [Aquilegia coerulea]|uniref:RING-type domain-containing protein n=1 Tax=Aquilegia coerulea TaxID=218851 RepID=A0A2G5EBF7_AQUCA|nr:hypothetical protein AQUCO_01000635v1 [Aquilegia coerulea]
MEQIIMTALLTLTPHQFSDLTHSLSSDFRLQHHRRCSLLLAPARFTHTLHFLNSLSLHQKTILIARYLLTTLQQLTLIWDIYTETTATTGPGLTRLRDYDAVLLLMLLCEVSQHDPQALETSSTNWIDVLQDYTLNNMFTVSGIGASSGTILSNYIDIATRCWRFLEATGYHMEMEVGTSAAAVVSLPSVNVSGGKNSIVECVICKEEMSEGRDVCQLPCQHMFHWICVLRWLEKTNTCPCCRFQLPSDDVFAEIERLWGILIKKGSRKLWEF